MRPTFKIVLFARTNANGSRPVMLRVTNLRRSKYYPLHRYATPAQWDESAGRFRKNFKGYLIENDMLRTYEQRASDALRFKRRVLYSQAVNEHLKVIAERAGVSSEGLSFYVARHTYANAHKQAGTSREVIRELMGHSDYKTAEHYLSAFEDERLDAADRGLFGG